MTSERRTYVHESVYEGGCDSCLVDAANAYLNGDEPTPVCTTRALVMALLLVTPVDDGDGGCYVCGHAIAREES